VGTAAAEVPWLLVEPTKLDPAAVQQTLTVRAASKTLPADAVSGAVILTTERGERARVVFELQSGPSLTVLAALAIGLVTLGVIGAILLATLL